MLGKRNGPDLVMYLALAMGTMRECGLLKVTLDFAMAALGDNGQSVGLHFGNINGVRLGNMVGINVGYSDSAVSARSFVGGEEGTTDDVGLGDGLGMNNIWVVV